MFKKFQSLAQNATTASRRGFLRSLGKVAASAAMAAAGVLATSSLAFGERGGKPGGTLDSPRSCCSFWRRTSCSQPAEGCVYIGCTSGDGCVVDLQCIWDCSGVQENTRCLPR